MFVLLIVHVALHRRFVLGILKKGRTGARLKSFAVRVAAGVIASATVYTLVGAGSLFRALPPAKDSAQAITAGVPGKGDKIGAPVTAGPAAAALDEFLGKLYCTGCHRRCPLTVPQCSIGVRQAEEQAAAYEARSRD